MELKSAIHHLISNPKRAVFGLAKLERGAQHLALQERDLAPWQT